MPDAETSTMKPSLETGDAFNPQLPPQIPSQTADEFVEMMNKTPLFMTSLDEVDGGSFDSLLKMRMLLSKNSGQRIMLSLRRCEHYSMRERH